MKSRKPQPPKHSREQAKKAFLKHWQPIMTAMQDLLQDGFDGDFFRTEILPRMTLIEIDFQRMLIKDISHAGGQHLFDNAIFLIELIGSLAQQSPPPDWLVKLAAKEYAVPWLMINGKPAPGFPETDAVLHWGQAVIKRSKNQFENPQTQAVAYALYWLKRGSIPQPSIEDRDKLEAMPDGKLRNEILVKIRGEKRKILSALPPFSRMTKAQWWPLLRRFIRFNADLFLTNKEKQNIRKTTPHKTDAEVINEFLKRCRMAFDGLCPAE